VPLFAAILRIPFAIIAPVILIVCAVGAYTVHNSVFDIYLMFGFGIVGYVFKKLNYPLAPLVLALVLGDRAEDSFRQSMLLSQGDLAIFFQSGIAGVLTTLAILLLIWPLFASLLPKARRAVAQ
jgi:putative tricarboxylic transport membrane protein